MSQVNRFMPARRRRAAGGRRRRRRRRRRPAAVRSARPWRAGERADHLALRVENLDRDLRRRPLLQVVVDRDVAIETAQRVDRIEEMQRRRS